MTHRTIGILGGMGPQATVLLMQRIIDATPARDDADHVRLIVDQNPQVPSRIRHLLEGEGEDPGPVLARMAAALERAGADLLAMPCNTAHHYAPAIRAATRVPLLDMVALSVERAVRLAGQGGRIGVLCSPAVRRTGLFEAPLARAGFGTVYAPDDLALATIRRVKADGVGEEARAAFTMASSGMLVEGARTQLIACTEFSLLADAVAEGVRAIDTLDVLVEAIVAAARPAGPQGGEGAERPRAAVPG